MKRKPRLLRQRRPLRDPLRWDLTRTLKRIYGRPLHAADLAECRLKVALGVPLPSPAAMSGRGHYVAVHRD